MNVPLWSCFFDSSSFWDWAIELSLSHHWKLFGTLCDGTWSFLTCAFWMWSLILLPVSALVVMANSWHFYPSYWTCIFCKIEAVVLFFLPWCLPRALGGGCHITPWAHIFSKSSFLPDGVCCLLAIMKLLFAVPEIRVPSSSVIGDCSLVLASCGFSAGSPSGCDLVWVARVALPKNWSRISVFLPGIGLLYSAKTLSLPGWSLPNSSCLDSYRIKLN